MEKRERGKSLVIEKVGYELGESKSQRLDRLSWSKRKIGHGERSNRYRRCNSTRTATMYDSSTIPGDEREMSEARGGRWQ